MGAGKSVAASAVGDLLDRDFPPHARFHGLHNFGDTSYANAVLQALFACGTFRRQLVQYYVRYKKKRPRNYSVTMELGRLFWQMQQCKQRMMLFKPGAFLDSVSTHTDLFDELAHPDAHELLRFLLTQIADDVRADQELERQQRDDFIRQKLLRSRRRSAVAAAGAAGGGAAAAGGGGGATATSVASSSSSSSSVDAKSSGNSNSDNSNNNTKATSSAATSSSAAVSSAIVSNSNNAAVSSGGSLDEQLRYFARLLVHENVDDTDALSFVEHIFSGAVEHQTTCMRCETVTSFSEPFVDLSLNMEHNASITHCLRQFSAPRVLRGADKYYCESCCCRQEAFQSTKIKTLPNVLTLRLNRFQWMEASGRMKKLSFRVVFPVELKLFNTALSTPEHEADTPYRLFAVIVHVGAGVRNGHYVTMVHSYGQWFLFDDDNVQMMSEDDINACFGSLDEHVHQDGYILFYERLDCQRHDEYVLEYDVKPAPPASSASSASEENEENDSDDGDSDDADEHDDEHDGKQGHDTDKFHRRFESKSALP